MKRGFTLIEMLTAIGIVVILVALIFSALRRVVDSAKVTVCISNLKEIGTALELYRNDYADDPPSIEGWSPLEPYLGNAQLKCPMSDMAQPEIAATSRVSYFLTANPNTPPFQFKQDLACREKRGPAFPVAYDANHASTLVAYANGGRFYIFVRRDTSVGRDKDTKSRFLQHDESLPCPDAEFWANF